MRIKFGLTFGILFLIGCTSTEQFKLPEIIRIESGQITGKAIAGSSVVAFKGIPFAAAPVGEWRWREPQPVKPWDGVRGCENFGPSAIQQEQGPFMCWSTEFIIDTSENSAGYSEDCLSLNVWTDGASTDGKRPVIVYIYGGGFTSGGSSCEIYDGQPLAEKGVVFVSINYRVGILGFLTHPELSQESPHGVSGNYGILDQIAALKWVQRNIAAFGGDPGNVTIQGQSAGAASVAALIASPLAAGLFHRAISQSFNSLNRDLMSLEEKSISDMESLGNKSLAELRSMSTADLLGLNYRGSSFCIDGWVLPKSPADAYSAGIHNDVPLISSMTKEDNMLFRFLPVRGFGPAQAMTVEEYKRALKDSFKDRYEDALNIYPAATDAEAQARSLEIASDNNNALQYGLAGLRSRSGKSDTFLYYFTRVMPGPESDRWGAFHTADVPYSFNHFSPLRQTYWTETDFKLGDMMSSYLVNLARTGNPNGSGLPEWPGFETDIIRFIEFGDTVQVYSMPSEKADLWSSHYNF
jgi:para-nitrobenzyl esterase